MPLAPVLRHVTSNSATKRRVPLTAVIVVAVVSAIVVLPNFNLMFIVGVPVAAIVPVTRIVTFFPTVKKFVGRVLVPLTVPKSVVSVVVFATVAVPVAEKRPDEM